MYKADISQLQRCLGADPSFQVFFLLFFEHFFLTNLITLSFKKAQYFEKQGSLKENSLAIQKRLEQITSVLISCFHKIFFSQLIYLIS